MGDYYETLGVERDAGADEIKKAFRRLARETHPDANPGDAGAEERFRAVAEAYEVLSDPQRRAAYDRGDHVDIGDLFSSFAGVDDLLSRFFGGGFGGFGRPAGPASGSDIGVRVSVELEEAASGAEREISYRAQVTCDTCSGSGAAPGSDVATCDRCGGQGSVRVTRQTILGTAMTVAACDRCRGRGKVVTDPCPTCRSTGSVADTVTLTIEIPPGIEDGARLRLTGRGGAGEPGGRPGDLYVEVAVAPDPRFERHGPDLVHRVHVGIAEAALGTVVAVPAIVGDPIEMDVPAGTQPGAVFRLSKEGMPRLGRRGRGDLLVEVVVEVPKRLSKAEEAALREFAGERGEEPKSRRHR